MSDHIEGISLSALDILRRCMNGDADIRRIEDSISIRRDTLTRCTQSISGMPRGGSGVEDKMAETICEIAELEQRRTERKREHAAEMCAGMWIVERLPPDERTALKCIYLEGRGIRGTARAMGYSDSSVRRFIQSGERRCSDMHMDCMVGFLPEWYEQRELMRHENV